jgi:hypothetical protein
MSLRLSFALAFVKNTQRSGYKRRAKLGEGREGNQKAMRETNFVLSALSWVRIVIVKPQYKPAITCSRGP